MNTGIFTFFAKKSKIDENKYEILKNFFAELQ